MELRLRDAKEEEAKFKTNGHGMSRNKRRSKNQTPHNGDFSRQSTAEQTANKEGAVAVRESLVAAEIKEPIPPLEACQRVP